jgi:hypothetical protein
VLSLLTTLPYLLTPSLLLLMQRQLLGMQGEPPACIATNSDVLTSFLKKQHIANRSNI